MRRGCSESHFSSSGSVVWWGAHAVAERAEHDVLVVAEDHARAELAEAADHVVGEAELEDRVARAEQLVDIAHALDGDVQRLCVAVDVRDDPEAHGRIPYSGKIEVTTFDGALDLELVGEPPDDRGLAGAAGRDAAADQPSGVDEQAGRDALGETVFLEVADLLAELGELQRVLGAAVRLPADDLRLLVARRVVELDGDEALPRGVLEVLERGLVAGVVGEHQQEALGRLEELAALVERQQPAVVGERVDEDGGVLARLDDLVEVADRPRLHGAGDRPVDPDRLVALEQVAPDEVGGAEVLVTGDGDQRHALRLVAEVLVQPPGHVLDEAGLAAAGRALEEDGDLLLVGDLEEVDLVADGQVEGLFGEPELLDLDLLVVVVGAGLGCGHRAYPPSAAAARASASRRAWARRRPSACLMRRWRRIHSWSIWSRNCFCVPELSM